MLTQVIWRIEMKTYSKNSAVRKPMMYGGGASMPKKKMMGGGMSPMGAGMMADKKKKAMMGMKHGGLHKKK